MSLGPRTSASDNILPSIELVEARGANEITGSFGDSRIEVSDPLGGHRAGDALLRGRAATTGS